MKKFIALFLVISFLGMNCATYERGEGINLSPDQKPGVKLVIQKTDGQQVRGELIAIRQNSLLLKESESGADVSVGLTDIKTIMILKESKVSAGVGAGLLAGGVIGALAGYLLSDKEEELQWSDAEWFLWSDAQAYTALGGVIGAVAGALIGWMFSAKAGKDEIIQIEGKSDTEIKKIFEELRKNARVPDFH